MLKSIDRLVQRFPLQSPDIGRSHISPGGARNVGRKPTKFEHHRDVCIFFKKREKHREMTNKSATVKLYL